MRPGVTLIDSARIPDVAGFADKATLHLALLLHDLGKGFEEDHSEVGRRMARETAQRFRLPPDQAETLEFLVHKHLRMSHLALNEPAVLAAVEDSAVLPGRLAAGNNGRRWARRNGTSVAAPQFARRLLNTGGQWHGLPIVEPNMRGERGDGLSPAGEERQFDRVGLGQIMRG